MWRVKRFELKTNGPILGHYEVAIQMEDADNLGPVKYEQRSILASDFIADPNTILAILQTDGYTPNDFGLA